MLKLLKHLKNSVPLILVAVLFLCGQAVTELMLPAYTSDIVDVGIQQGGIDETIPHAVRETEMEKLLLFVSEEEREFVLDSYRLIRADMFDGENLEFMLEQYPQLASDPVYELRVNDEASLTRLTDILSVPMLLLSGSAASVDGAFAGYASVSPEAFAQMSSDDRTALVETITSKLEAVPASMYTQASAQFIRNEYASIGIDVDAAQIKYIVTVGLKMLGLALLSMIAAILVSLCFSRIGASFARDVRFAVFEKITSFGSAEFDRFSTASLITRSTNDVQQVQMFLTMGLRILCFAPITAIGGIVMVLRTNTSMAWIIVLAVAAVLGLVVVMYRTTMPKFKIVQKLIDRLNLVTREILSGLPVIRSFSAEKREEARFRDANEELTRTSLFVNRIMAGLMPVLMLVMNVVTILIMWNGAHGIDAGSMQVGDLMAFIQYTMQIISAFLMISMISITIPRASVASERICEVLDTEISVNEPAVPMKLPANGKGEVEFRNVSFRYPGADEDIISDISFVAHPGETTAIIGSTGCGKSTLIHLIPRLYDVTEGAVLFDGVDVRDISTHDLREKIGFVPQKGVLFSGTIDSNLRFGKTLASDEAIRRAAKVAQAHDFVMERENGYQSDIAQGGTNVSGGQKQRLAIARAIVKNPSVYIFDDSFSALDYKTDITLRRELKNYTLDAAVIIVAQRISTILHAEQIIVLDEGKIVGKGTHKELLASCEVYRQIASSQLSKEELDQ